MSARVYVVFFGAVLSACGAGQKQPAQAPAAEGAAAPAKSSDYADAPSAPPASPAPGAQPSAPPAAQAEAVAPESARSTAAPRKAPSSASAGGAQSSRAIAINQAAGEVEAAQRELDVAGGDCRNACRALGSMDRATGRVCELTRDGGEPRRCDDAKQKLYGARDRVKGTCGGCPDGAPSVERSAPIPSIR